MKRRLPLALTESEDFQELTPEQAESLQSRLDYVDEIIENVASWLEGNSDWENTYQFLNDLELDVSVNQNLESTDAAISSWLIHTSWGDGVGDRVQLANLPPDLQESLNVSVPLLGADEMEAKEWLNTQKDGLRFCLDLIERADTYSASLTLLLSLDILMAQLLSGLYRLRFMKRN